jgi:hypothetical protein
VIEDPVDMPHDWAKIPELMISGSALDHLFAQNVPLHHIPSLVVYRSSPA